MADTDPCMKNEDQEGCTHSDGAALSAQLRTSESLLSTAWWEE